MKLELKHVAPYLTYKLPAKLSQQGIFNLDLEYPNENVYKIGYIEDFYFVGGKMFGTIRVSEKTSFDFEEGDVDILLRPLSDLTKEIEVNGKKFIPAEIIIKEYLADVTWGSNEVGIGVLNKDGSMRDLCFMLGEITLECPLMIYEFLCEWHFDVFGLIEKGLAYDINELNNS